MGRGKRCQTAETTPRASFAKEAGADRSCSGGRQSPCLSPSAASASLLAEEAIRSSTRRRLTREARLSFATCWQRDSLQQGVCQLDTDYARKEKRTSRHRIVRPRLAHVGSRASTEKQRKRRARSCL